MCVHVYVRNLVKQLGAAGIFTAKDGANPSDARSKIRSLFMPSSSKEQAKKSSPNYDVTSNVTKENKEPGSTENMKKRLK